MEYRDFSELAAVTRLRQLARAPFDLTLPGALDARRVEDYRLSSCGFDCLYATQRVDDAVLDGLQDLADEAGVVDKFLAAKEGAVVNRIEGVESENRQVLHTAVRDIFTDSPCHGEASARARQQLDRLRGFLDDLDRGLVVNEKGEAFTTMVQIGIGGSDLGPRALYLALKKYERQGRSARFLANVDPDDAAAVLADLDLSRTLFNVVSKSGTTLETLTNEQLVRDALAGAGLDPGRHLVSVTGAGSPMDNPDNYLASFHMFDYIGGRYSVTSMVGAVTLGFTLGYDAFVDILNGAHEMDRAAEQRNIRRNIPLLMAMLGIWNRNFLGCDTVAVLPYSRALARFPAHLQQCDMESNGKSVSRSGQPVTWATGPVVWGEPGTNGQHAFYQLLHQGTTVVPVEFIGFRQSQFGRDAVVQGTTSQEKLVANMLAQVLALARGRRDGNPNRNFAGNRPGLVLLGERLTPRTMGALLALYESKIIFQGFCWNINSFDQEGVQLGKNLAIRLLNAIEAQGSRAPAGQDSDPAEHALLEACGFLKKAG